VLVCLQFSFTVPLRTQLAALPGTSYRTEARGGDYLITYLDKDIFVGRAEQGTFIFSKEL
jgi:hypothetical protein